MAMESTNARLQFNLYEYKLQTRSSCLVSLPIVDCCRHGCASASHSAIWYLVFFFNFIFFLFHRRRFCVHWVGRATMWNGCTDQCVVFSVSVAVRCISNAPQYFNAFSRIIYYIRARVRLCSADGCQAGGVSDRVPTHLRAPPFGVQSARFALTPYVERVPFHRMLPRLSHAIVRVFVWVRAMVNNHFAISLDEQISHIWIFFARLFRADVCARVCRAISILANIISLRRRSEWTMYPFPESHLAHL